MSNSWTRAQAISLIGALAGWVSLLFYWSHSQARDPLRLMLSWFNPMMVGIVFAALVFSAGYFGIPAMRSLWRQIPRWALVGAAAACLLGFSLVQFVAPQTHHILYDEDIYEAIGLNIEYGGRSAIPNDGQWRFGQFVSTLNEYYKQPTAWPFLLSLIYRVAGPGEGQAFFLTHLLFALTILLLFLSAWLMTGQPAAALLASLIYAILPENVRWFSTTAIEPSTICFATLTFFSLLMFLRFRTSGLLFLFICALAMAVQFRVESGVLVLLMAVMLVSQAPEEIQTPRLAWFGMLFLVLVTGHMMHLFAMHKEPWGSNGTRFALSFLRHNMATNSHYFFQNARFPIAVTLLAIVGLLVFNSWRQRAWMVLWLFVGWFPFVFFYAGSYNYGADVRFSLLTFPPMMILAGVGLDRIRRIFKGKEGTRNGTWFCGAFLLLLLFGYLPTMRVVGEEAWEARDDHEVAKQFAALIPEDGLVLTHDPCMFQINGVNAAQMFLGNNPTYIQQVLRPRYHDRLYLHWDYWCNVENKTQVGFAQYILNHFSCRLILEKFVRDRRFALYQIGDPVTASPTPTPKIKK